MLISERCWTDEPKPGALSLDNDDGRGIYQVLIGRLSQPGGCFSSSSRVWFLQTRFLLAAPVPNIGSSKDLEPHCIPWFIITFSIEFYWNGTAFLGWTPFFSWLYHYFLGLKPTFWYPQISGAKKRPQFWPTWRKFTRRKVGHVTSAMGIMGIQWKYPLVN